MLNNKEIESHLRRADWLATLLDNRFEFLGFRFGLDPLINLVPFLGTAFTSILSLYLVWIGVQMNLPRQVLVQMLVYILIDYLLDFIPVLGNVFDFVYKANIKNLEILKKHHNTKTGIIEGEVIE